MLGLPETSAARACPLTRRDTPPDFTQPLTTALQRTQTGAAALSATGSPRRPKAGPEAPDPPAAPSPPGGPFSPPMSLYPTPPGCSLAKLVRTDSRKRNPRKLDAPQADHVTTPMYYRLRLTYGSVRV